MGKRGPQPTPTKTLKLRGSWRAKTRENEPEPEILIPECPEWLSDQAKTEWERVAPLLERLGLISDLYLIPLAMYCQAVDDYITARKSVMDEGIVSTTDKGNVVQHPAVGVMNKAWERAMKAAKEFGMTPSAMSGIKSPEKSQKKNDKSKYFNRTG